MRSINFAPCFVCLCVLLLLATISETAAGNLNRTECQAAYGTRDFIPKEKRDQLLNVLWSFPGSGNTWVRLLIEYSSGYYSSSIYNDRALYKELPGESFWEGGQTIVVKLHPGLMVAYPLPKWLPTKKSVFLIRDPFHSMFSHFNIHRMRSHNLKIPLKHFRYDSWYQFSNHTVQNNYALHWKKTFNRYVNDHPDGAHFVRYEDLVNPETRVSTLKLLMSFLELEVSEERLECAFLLSVKESIYRGAVPAPASTQQFVTKDTVYSDPEYVCKVWKSVGKYYKPHGYHAYNNITCPWGLF